MGQFLPDNIYPMAGMRTRRFCLANIIAPLAVLLLVLILWFVCGGGYREILGI